MPAAVAHKPASWNWTTALSVGAMLIGLLLRLLAARGDPWLDEIWSWKIAREGGVFLPADNNHMTNTIWLWLVQDIHVAVLWRLPAVIAGTASIYVAGTILRRLGHVHAVAGMWLMACCYPLVVYQSEARGYSVMLLCMLLAIPLVLRRVEGEQRSLWKWQFCIVCMIGTLSHLAFVLFYGLVILWMLPQRPWRRMLAEQWPTMVFMVAWWMSFARRMKYLGGPSTRWDTVLEDISRSLTLLSPLALAVVLAAAGWAIFARDRRLSALLMLMVGLYPLAVIAPSGGMLYLRYFLPAIVGAVMMLGALVGELWQRRQRAGSLAPALCLLALQIHNVRPLLEFGRDRQQTMLAGLDERGGSIGSRQDNQLRVVVEYYDAVHHTHLSQRVEAVDDAPAWMIEMGDGRALPALTNPDAYQPYRHSPGQSWSGIDWHVYRRRDAIVTTR